MNAAMWMAWGGMAGFAGIYGGGWAKMGEKGRKWLEWGLAALVAGVSAVSVSLHEPWADELHAWLTTRDLTTVQLWAEMAYEGHVLPWHLILHPFARGGAPVETMGWISWAINAATVAWFARRAPLGGWAKAAVALSCVFLYVNPVVSRPYVLVPPLLFGLASLWRQRDERPVAFGLLVALLANTHVSMGGTAGLLFLAFARNNVFRRGDGKCWMACGRQLGGLVVMAAGGLLAVAQVLPSLWKTSTELGMRLEGFSVFAQGFHSAFGMAAVAAGLAWLGMDAWRRDKELLFVFAGSLLFLACISVFVYPSGPANRALLWWPVALGAAWALGGGDGNGRRCACRTLAVTAMALGLMRPDMTWRDWRGAYDPLPGACRWIAERYGKDAEVWINGQNYLAEGALAYLDNLWDWQTGRQAGRIRFKTGWEYAVCPFGESRGEVFRLHPEKESFLALVTLGDGSGLMPQSAVAEGMEVEYLAPWSMLGKGAMVVKVPGIRPAGNGDGVQSEADMWMGTGMERLGRSDLEGAMDAWKRVLELAPGQWEAMNNLAWVLLEAGRVAEAREWIDRAMEHGAARENAGVRDTEAAVRRAEGDEAGAREAEAMQDGMRKPK